MTGSTYEAEGLVSVRSTVSLMETIAKICLSLCRGGGWWSTLSIDHAKEADRVGVTLRPTHLFITGYTDVEAPVIAKCQLLGMDLPHKILSGKTKMARLGSPITIRFGPGSGITLEAMPVLSSKQSEHRWPGLRGRRQARRETPGNIRLVRATPAPSA